MTHDDMERPRNKEAAGSKLRPQPQPSLKVTLSGVEKFTQNRSGSANGSRDGFSRGQDGSVDRVDRASDSKSKNEPAFLSEAVIILLDNMTEHPKDHDLQTRAMRSLRRLSASDEGRELIGNSGGISLVADCMQRFSDRMTLLTTCCMVIANLAFNNEENKDRARKLKVVHLLVGLLSNADMTADQIAYVCLAVRNVSSGYRVNQAYLSANGAVPALCKVADKHLTHVETQIQVVGALGNIANTNKSAQMQVRENGGLQLIVGAMRAHFNEPSLVESGMVAIRNLCLENERNQAVVGELGGVDQVVQAMRSFSKQKSLQVRGCAALRYLAFDAKNRLQLGENGGVSAIVSAFAVVGEDVDDVVEIMRALSNCTFDDKENKLTAVRCDVIEIVAKYLTAERHTDCLEAGFRVLRNLTDCSAEVRSRIIESGAFSSAITCIRERKPVPGVGEHALALLLLVLSDSEHADALSRDIDLDELESRVTEWTEAVPEDLKSKQHGTSLVSLLRRLRFSMGDDRAVRRNTAKGKVTKLFKKMSKSMSYTDLSLSPRGTQQGTVL